MKLIVGGHAQGKLQYVLENYKVDEWMIAEAEMPENAEKVIINHFHLWVRSMMEKNEDPEQVLWEYLKIHKACIIISDEIGNGLVPVDAFERSYRERTGRILCAMAKQAEEVVRVICGMGQKIK